jgi:hypothetical protein
MEKCTCKYNSTILSSVTDASEWSVSRTCRFIPGMQHPVPVVYEAKWTPQKIWALWRRQSKLPVLDIDPHPLGHAARNLIAVPTELGYRININ